MLQHPIANKLSPFGSCRDKVLFIRAVHFVALSMSKVVMVHQQLLGKQGTAPTIYGANPVVHPPATAVTAHHIPCLYNTTVKRDFR